VSKDALTVLFWRNERRLRDIRIGFSYSADHGDRDEQRIELTFCAKAVTKWLPKAVAAYFIILGV
jgi:hypothetical protein